MKTSTPQTNEVKESASSGLEEMEVTLREELHRSFPEPFRVALASSESSLSRTSLEILSLPPSLASRINNMVSTVSAAEGRGLTMAPASLELRYLPQQLQDMITKYVVPEQCTNHSATSNAVEINLTRVSLPSTYLE